MCHSFFKSYTKFRMPANLPPEYLKVEEKYRLAKTPEEKLKLTEELIRLAPKHKGTEKLLKLLKQRAKKLREEIEREKARKITKGIPFAVKKEGAGQVVLLGLPNSGKSTLLSKLTSAKPEIGEHPFTTTRPFPGMMDFEDVQVQLVEAPGVVEGSCEGKGLGAAPLGLARSADALLLVVEAGKEREQLEVLLGELKKAGVEINPARTAVFVTKTDIRRMGEFHCPFKVLKLDESVRKEIFRLLHVIRVYTKRPGEEPAKKPLVLPEGSTVLDAARRIHEDFAERLDFARVWGSARFPGQRVPRDYVLADGDVVEFHLK
jgi:ribosome-interacting GTPase 1